MRESRFSNACVTLTFCHASTYQKSSSPTTQCRIKTTTCLFSYTLLPKAPVTRPHVFPFALVRRCLIGTCCQQHANSLTLQAILTRLLFRQYIIASEATRSYEKPPEAAARTTTTTTTTTPATMTQGMCMLYCVFGNKNTNKPYRMDPLIPQHAYHTTYPVGRRVPVITSCTRPCYPADE